MNVVGAVVLLCVAGAEDSPHGGFDYIHRVWSLGQASAHVFKARTMPNSACARIASTYANSLRLPQTFAFTMIICCLFAAAVVVYCWRRTSHEFWAINPSHTNILYVLCSPIAPTLHCMCSALGHRLNIVLELEHIAMRKHGRTIWLLPALVFLLFWA